MTEDVGRSKERCRVLRVFWPESLTDQLARSTEACTLLGHSDTIGSILEIYIYDIEGVGVSSHETTPVAQFLPSNLAAYTRTAARPVPNLPRFTLHLHNRQHFPTLIPQRSDGSLDRVHFVLHPGQGKALGMPLRAGSKGRGRQPGKRKVMTSKRPVHIYTSSDSNSDSDHHTYINNSNARSRSSSSSYSQSSNNTRWTTGNDSVAWMVVLVFVEGILACTLLIFRHEYSYSVVQYNKAVAAYILRQLEWYMSAKPAGVKLHAETCFAFSESGIWFTRQWHPVQVNIVTTFFPYTLVACFIFWVWVLFFEPSIIRLPIILHALSLLLQATTAPITFMYIIMASAFRLHFMTTNNLWLAMRNRCRLSNLPSLLVKSINKRDQSGPDSGTAALLQGDNSTSPQSPKKKAVSARSSLPELVAAALLFMPSLLLLPTTVWYYVAMCVVHVGCCLGPLVLMYFKYLWLEIKEKIARGGSVKGIEAGEFDNKNRSQQQEDEEEEVDIFRLAASADLVPITNAPVRDNENRKVAYFRLYEQHKKKGEGNVPHAQQQATEYRQASAMRTSWNVWQGAWQRCTEAWLPVTEILHRFATGRLLIMNGSIFRSLAES